MSAGPSLPRVLRNLDGCGWTFRQVDPTWFVAKRDDPERLWLLADATANGLAAKVHSRLEEQQQKVEA